MAGQDRVRDREGAGLGETPADVARDGYALCECVFDAWRSYWMAVLSARTAEDLHDAGAGLFSDGASLALQAAAVRQRFAGVVAPTLHEA